MGGEGEEGAKLGCSPFHGDTHKLQIQVPETLLRQFRVTGMKLVGVRHCM